MTLREIDAVLEELQDKLVELSQATEDVDLIYHLSVIVKQVHELRESLHA